MTVSSQTLEEGIAQCTGTSTYWKHPIGKITYTDGIKWVADTAGAYWLIDLIASHQGNASLKREWFQLWEMTVTGRSAVVTCRHDTGTPPLVTQRIGYTDFPEGTWKFYLIDGVLMVPREY